MVGSPDTVRYRGLGPLHRSRALAGEAFWGESQVAVAVGLVSHLRNRRQSLGTADIWAICTHKQGVRYAELLCWASCCPYRVYILHTYQNLKMILVLIIII